MNRKIKELREKRFPGRGGATLCAEEFGVGRQYWYDWETGKKTPGTRNQRRLAEFFGITVEELRGEEQSSPPALADGEEGGTARLIAVVFQFQEAMANFGHHLAAGKSADAFPELDELIARIQALQERLAALRRIPENRERRA